MFFAMSTRLMRYETAWWMAVFCLTVVPGCDFRLKTMYLISIPLPWMTVMPLEFSRATISVGLSSR